MLRLGSQLRGLLDVQRLLGLQGGAQAPPPAAPLADTSEALQQGYVFAPAAYHHMGSCSWSVLAILRSWDLRMALLLWLWTCCVFNNAGRLQRVMRASPGASMNCAEAGGDERAHAAAAAGLCDRQVRQVHLRPHQRGPGLLLLRHARHLRPPADRRAGAARLRGTPTGCRRRRQTCMLRRSFSRGCTAAAPACAWRQARLCMPLSSSAVWVSEPGLVVLAV